jgi:cyclophilin family peptidyl-prolyl cis-trans isomerase
MSSRKARERQLAKLAARRAAERRKQRRQRIITIVVALALVIGALAFAGVALLGNTKKSASPTPTPSHTLPTTPPPTTAPPTTPAPTPSGVACGGTVPKAASVKKPTNLPAPSEVIDPKKTYVATMVTSCGTMQIQLTPSSAPTTVNSIVSLLQKHFFDGLTFHRIVAGFVVQGGDPVGDGTGGPGYRTVDTPAANTTYPIGTVAMAKGRSEAPGTSGSQFFIVLSDNPASLTQGGPGYAVIGHVTQGLDVLQKLGQLPVIAGPSGETSAPSQFVYIDSVSVKAA